MEPDILFLDSLKVTEEPGLLRLEALYPRRPWQDLGKNMLVGLSGEARDTPGRRASWEGWREIY